MTDFHGLTNGNGNGRQRDSRGRFLHCPGPGRPRGSRNAASWAALRDLVCELGTEGMTEALAELKDTDPGRFATCVSRFMPREDRRESLGDRPQSFQVVIQKEIPPDEILDLINRCLQLADGKPVTREVVIEAMRQRDAAQPKPDGRIG